MMLAGIPLRRILMTGDQVEFIVMQMVARKADQLEAQRREDLANRIVNGVGKLLSE